LSRLPAEAGDAWRESTAGRTADDGADTDTTYADWGLFLTERAHAAGVPIGAGTDTPIALAIPGYSLHSELEFLVRAGLSPLEAIESATVRPAEYFSLQDEMGSIDVGKKADMVLLNANPLDDISNTKKISAVVTKGVLLNSEDLKALVQTEN
jgi:imidazolonepropionase-like amidohydrolase